MLYKNIMNWSSCTTFQSQLYSSNHCNQQKQTCYQQQIYVDSIQLDSKLYNTRPTLVQRIPIWNQNTFLSFQKQRSIHLARLYRLIQGQLYCLNQSNQKDSSHWISSSLMGQNFGCWNIQQHNYKQKHNSQLSNINQQLQQLKIFQSKHTQQSRSMQENKNKIKYRINRVFGMQHQKSTCPATTLKDNKQQIHWCRSWIRTNTVGS